MQDFWFYLQLGWHHIISKEAIDHQLFILALMALFSFRSFRKVLILVTAFTAGHTLTLLLSSLDVVRVPSSWVEFLIPCTIVFTAADNLLLSPKRKGSMRIPYVLALFFGFIHGMGFANSVRMMLAQEQHLAVPLLGFNVGLEVGQIALVVVVLLFHLWAQRMKLPERYWVMLISLPAILMALIMAVERFPF